MSSQRKGEKELRRRLARRSKPIRKETHHEWNYRKNKGSMTLMAREKLKKAQEPFKNPETKEVKLEETS